MMMMMMIDWERSRFSAVNFTNKENGKDDEEEEKVNYGLYLLFSESKT